MIKSHLMTFSNMVNQLGPLIRVSRRGNVLSISPWYTKPPGLPTKRWITGPQITSAPDPSQVPTEPQTPQNEYGRKNWRPTAFKMFESAMTTLASIGVLGLIGYGYTRYYKHLVLQKMENAFKPGDPVLERVGSGVPTHAETQGSSDPDYSDSRGHHWVLRPEQEFIDEIVHGKVTQHYYLLIGEKGTGKRSMLIEAMRKNDGEGVAMFDAHADLEIFRVRLGKALDFEYHEDNIGGLFSIRGPRVSMLTQMKSLDYILTSVRMHPPY